MAYTPTLIYPAAGDSAPVHGNQRVRRVQLAHSGTYATGGEALTATDFGLQKLETVLAVDVQAATAAAVVSGAYVPSTGKLKLNTATAELANATSLTALVTEITVAGQ